MAPNRTTRPGDQSDPGATPDPAATRAPDADAGEQGTAPSAAGGSGLLGVPHVVQAPVAASVADSVAPGPEDVGTRRVRPHAHLTVAGVVLKPNEEADVPQGAELAGVIAAGLVTPVGEGGDDEDATATEQ